jgi:Family of unknown function (DUF5343)
MVVKKKGSKASKETSQKPTRPERGHAAFPYSDRPSGLRRFLSEVPRRPRPTRVNRELLAAWGLGGGANLSIIRVLKAVGLVSENNEPTENYIAFMREGTGPAVLAQLIRRTYAPLFEASHAPYRESAENLRNLFNIHSGGGTIDLQIQTFKALADSANFEASTAEDVTASSSAGIPTVAKNQSDAQAGNRIGPAVRIDLHIHLPPGKSSREYQYIIQDIARYLYGIGTDDEDSRNERL